MKIKSLIEQGNSLPIPDEKGKRQSFTFKVWRLAEEKKIGEIKNRQKNLGKFVREVFELMLETFDGSAWSAVDAPAKKLLLNRMPFANMFYMWCYLRFDALGADIKMAPIECPHCANQVKDFEADMSSLEVKCAGYNEDGTENPDYIKDKIYKLKKAIHVGDIKVTGIKYGFTAWDAMEKLPAGERNFGAIKESMLQHSIIGAISEESGDKVLPLQKELILKELSKKDIEGFYDELDEHNGGPVLAMTIPCPHCEQEFHQPLNWTYDYFFGSSSL